MGLYEFRPDARCDLRPLRCSLGPLLRLKLGGPIATAALRSAATPKAAPLIANPI